MASRPTPNRSTPGSSLLHAVDRGSIAVLVIVCMVAMTAYWMRHRTHLVEIDRAPQRVIRFELDINHAEWPEFTMLPDVGESLAKRIVDSRAADGPFADHEDLTRVKGIGPKTLARVRPYLMPMPNSQSVADSRSFERAKP